MTTASRLRPHAPGLVPAWLWALVLVAVLVAPWLGAVHAVVHAQPAPATAAVGAGTAAAETASADIGLRRLFGDHGHSGDCRVYDQLSHADGLHSASALPLVALPPVAVMAWHAGECLRRWATLFDARGPPFLA